MSREIMKHLQVSQLIPHFLDLKNVILHKRVFYSIAMLKRWSLISEEITAANTLDSDHKKLQLFCMICEVRCSSQKKEFQNTTCPNSVQNTHLFSSHKALTEHLYY